MKKISLCTVSLFMAFVILGGKENQSMSISRDEIPIELKELIIIPKPGPKSISPVRVWFTRKPCTICLEIAEPKDSIIVTVEDAKSRIIVQQTVDENIDTATIILPLLELGSYTLTIKSSSYLVVGTFEVR